MIDLTGSSDLENKGSIPRKRKRKDASRSPSPTGLFMVDLSPQKITEELSLSNANVPHVQKEGRLLLPAHVSILGSAAVEIIECNVDQQEYVEYLDYGGPDVSTSSFLYLFVKQGPGTQRYSVFPTRTRADQSPECNSMQTLWSKGRSQNQCMHYPYSVYSIVKKQMNHVQ